MANKRLKKKLETKRKKSLLVSEGYSKKETKKLKGRELETVYKKKAHNRKNRERAREIANLAKQWGLSPSKYNSWKKLLPEIERIKKEQDREAPFLLIYYQDFTGETDSKFIYDFKKRNNTRSRSQITESIIGWLQNAHNKLFLGRVAIRIVPKRDVSKTNTLWRNHGYVKIYEGQGKELSKLLTAIETIMVGVYDVKERDKYLKELVAKLRSLPYEKAKKNAKEIQKMYDTKSYKKESWDNDDYY
ncbi:hypothetical protein BK764_00470 [Bacillus thuringiensis serovar israelensis]|uniref:hypothetical protein n=1 Tax=Bacillus thuringiensis TaxID=1428 RepID=UPI000A3B6A22|nr:hypothetical protein [Bacillus thuringiensis]OTZ62268.1 hypothetical protein BK764_00470 [Bacillus thuringiensis serovar israelensis]